MNSSVFLSFFPTCHEPPTASASIVIAVPFASVRVSVSVFAPVTNARAGKMVTNGCPATIGRDVTVVPLRDTRSVPDPPPASVLMRSSCGRSDSLAESGNVTFRVSPARRLAGRSRHVPKASTVAVAAASDANSSAFPFAAPTRTMSGRGRPNASRTSSSVSARFQNAIRRTEPAKYFLRLSSVTDA